MEILKKIISLSITMIIVFTLFASSTVEAAYKLPFETNSKAIYMVNTDTNTVVYEKNKDEKIIPASLTKIMTTIIALETVKDLEGTIVTAPSYIYDEFFGLNVSTADIRQKEQVRMIDLLYAMILPSANEAASIVADYIGDGSIAQFVDMMNKKAKEIGAKNTVFKNPHGLMAQGQVTTAYDLYLITKYALSLPMFEKICTTTSYQMPATNKHSQPYNISHTNYMLSKVRGGSYYYPYAKGIKTGTLPEVGKNLISMASKDGYNYLLISLGAPEVDSSGKPLGKNGAFEDAQNLYKWALTSFKHQTIIKEGEVIEEAKVRLSSGQDYVSLLAKNDVTALLPSDVDATAIQKIPTILKDVRAPVKKGDVLGRLDLKLNDEIIQSVDLVAYQDIHRSLWKYSFDLVKRFLNNTIVRVLLIILLLLVLIFLVLKARYRKLQRLRAARSRYIRKMQK
ncbi:D-alanyl-D-alanine carboxypeptidase family protein [Paludicola sp. MB14-C6]|uniref:D-alanyl-D-alanine carboxypeptidase family protein n=1 Tax=Paludihabitans sp. MB14-C6 TaxID=3070656 RepID=UPI0027DC506A|nr:D-alanyl-D-alanine carboxypeptidase family protein [Paludicola sp. MB14-C6]WMJ23741.1 D-alanyl-D-alanine carboxypeptidase family protein [Paludicola sp. MB14-C6]